MGIKDDAKKVLNEFEKTNEKLKGKAYLTDSDRSWEEQLDIILDPKRKANYPNIKKSFLDKFKDLKDKLPAKRGELSKDQLSWWKDEIMKQAGKSPGFPHVGGKAADMSVKNLDSTAKTDLQDRLKKASLKILLEYVTADDSEYGVSLAKANVFHIYK